MKKITIILKKSLIIIILLLGISFIVYAYIQQIPSPGHGGDRFLVRVSGFTMTLQESIDKGFLVCGVSADKSYTTQVLDPGHTEDEIYVSVDGLEGTLKDAINKKRLCGSSNTPYIGSINPGHFADEILVSVSGSEMSLQDAIDSGEFCNTNICPTGWKEVDDYGGGTFCGVCYKIIESPTRLGLNLCAASKYAGGDFGSALAKDTVAHYIEENVNIPLGWEFTPEFNSRSSWNWFSSDYYGWEDFTSSHSTNTCCYGNWDCGYPACEGWKTYGRQTSSCQRNDWYGSESYYFKRILVPIRKT